MRPAWTGPGGRASPGAGGGPVTSVAVPASGRGAAGYGGKPHPEDGWQPRTGPAPGSLALRADQRGRARRTGAGHVLAPRGRNLMIEARGLVKRYGSTTAVDNLSFDVRPGTVTGFLGPNGAGKS